MSEPLLRIQNHHALACGDPPIVNSDDPNLYIGYFENPFGEQWIFSFDRKSGEALLRGGDAGWNTMFPVLDGEAVGLNLGVAELLWLQACWKAACGS